MRIKHFIIGFFTLACCFISSCKNDDYSPITLLYAVEDGDMPIDENNHLAITPFSEGEPFLIRGGSGNYHITATNKDIASFHYDGDTLTILPISPVPDSGEIIINDRSGNSYTLVVDINYAKRVFNVAEISAEVTGDELTFGEARELKNSIINDSPVQKGSEYTLTYTNDDLSGGEVIVTPQGLKGTFTQGEEWISHNGETSTEFIMYLNGEKHVYELNTKRAADGSMLSMEFKEEVTDNYKISSPHLENAYSIQKLEVPVTNNSTTSENKN